MTLEIEHNKNADDIVQAAFTSAESTDDTAWPRCAHKHILQLLVGFGAKPGGSDQLALNGFFVPFSYIFGILSLFELGGSDT
jgi:hypothetical protein